MITRAPSGEVRRISDELLSRIIAGIYPCGLRLPSEAALAIEFSCGRSTIREALRHLTDLGVLQSRRGSGAQVLDFRREGTPALMPRYIAAARFDMPVDVLALEMLRIRALLAAEAVRLAVRYAASGSLSDARRILASARTLEHDPVAHALCELELFRALVTASGIWPAVWLANVFWAPMRELYEKLAHAVRRTPADFQVQMNQLLDRIEARDEVAAADHLRVWLARVDIALLKDIASFFTQSAPDTRAEPQGFPRPVASSEQGKDPAS